MMVPAMAEKAKPEMPLGESKGQCTTCAEGEIEGEFSRVLVDRSIPPARCRRQINAVANNVCALCVDKSAMFDQMPKLLAGDAKCDAGIVARAGLQDSVVPSMVAIEPTMFSIMVTASFGNGASLSVRVSLSPRSFGSAL